MICEVNQGPTFTSGKHPCGICYKVVDTNSIFGNHCAHRVHECCSRMKGRLENVVNFKCRSCLNPSVAYDDDKKVRLGNIKYEVVDQFCYLCDILGARGMQRHVQYPVLGQVKKSLSSLCLFLHLKYLRIRWKESNIQLVSEVSCCMAAKPVHWRKVKLIELFEQTCKWYGGFAMSVIEIENHQKNWKIGWVFPM